MPRIPVQIPRSSPGTACIPHLGCWEACYFLPLHLFSSHLGKVLLAPATTYVVTPT